MDDTISRRQAIYVCLELMHERRKWLSDAGQKEISGIDAAMCAIQDLPSAQPEIVRCKDCKYWMRAYLSISGKHGCNVMRDYTAPDDYCFKAERKA